MSVVINNTATGIFRFDFSPDVVSKISGFATLHMDDDRKDYKKAWEPWCEEHKEMITEEIRRLKQSGYDGDINDKMYKAGRYYFRKKSKKAKKSGGQAGEGQAGGGGKVKVKRMYNTVKSETLVCIDAHIKEHIKDDDFSPKNGYVKFIKTSSEIVRSETQHLKRKFEMSDNDIKTKIKKTYKNRYYIIRSTRN